ncbi:hypothetical protein EDB83DRAFT_2525991 [Lactarius deliciosus]|nr:hypothetical protein EDB83DRAFT_2525991 [Lactarius deliciosus]
MPLTIVLNTLYSSKGREQERETAKRRILAHFVRMGFEKDGVEVATVKNTGWHGENGAVRYGGHLTVEFSKRNGKFTTEHVYRTDAAYEDQQESMQSAVPIPDLPAPAFASRGSVHDHVRSPATTDDELEHTLRRRCIQGDLAKDVHSRGSLSKSKTIRSRTAPRLVSEQPRHTHLKHFSDIPWIRLLATIMLEKCLWKGSKPPAAPAIATLGDLCPNCLRRPKTAASNLPSALTPPANRIVQRRSPAKPVTPIDHFRHDTEARYRDGERSSYWNGTSHHAETHYTGTSQYTDGTEGLDDDEDDGDSTDGEEDHDEKTEKPKPKSKFQEYLAKARTEALLNPKPEEKDTPQNINIFADPRRVVFPIPRSTTLEDEVPGTPVETRHFGPAPTRRVARRNKTVKRVPLTNGNLVLDLPVPPKLVLPRVGQPEVMKTRYTAVTCDPDDFERAATFCVKIK